MYAMYFPAVQKKQIEGEGTITNTVKCPYVGNGWGEVLFSQFSCKSEIVSKYKVKNEKRF